jgi:two-component system, chemotaxis family, chemotaxis protein CheY
MTTTLLIIDDSKVSRSSLKCMIEDIGDYHVAEACNVTEALTLLTDSKPAIIFCDYCMEPVNGLELLKKLKTTEDTKDIPFVLVTAFSDNSLINAVMQYGVSTYLLKPLSYERISKVLQYFPVLHDADGGAFS